MYGNNNNNDDDDDDDDVVVVVRSSIRIIGYLLPAFSVPGDKPEIPPAVLPAFIQCSLSIMYGELGKMWRKAVTTYFTCLKE
jgi:hypothetical protein